MGGQGLVDLLMWVLVIYDICDEKRLNKVAKLMESYGQRVQRSVFECELDRNSLARLQYQLEQSQWWTAEELFQHQLEQLSVVLTHAYKTVPFYLDYYKSQSFKPKRILTAKLFSEIPVIFAISPDI